MTPMALADAPAGYYEPGDIARLAGVSARKVGRWARAGYMQSAWADRAPRAYAYQDAAEAMVLHYLLDQGVPWRSIKRALAEARERHGSRWPLSSAQLFIVADHPQRRGAKKTVVVDGFDVVRQHEVLDRLDLVDVADELARGGWAVREHPELRHISVDPEVRSGEPVIRGTRVPVDLVASLAVRPGGLDLLESDYDISADQANDAVIWAEAVASYEFN